MLQWIADIAAIIIAVVALKIANQEAKNSRAHNRLSVKPNIYGERKSKLDSDNNQVTLELNLINTGPGTAIVRDFNVFYENEKYNLGFQSQVNDFKRKFIPEISPDELVHSSAHLAPGSALSIHETLHVLKIVVPISSQENLQKELELRLNQVVPLIRYASAYGDEYTFPPALYEKLSPKAENDGKAEK